MHPFIRFSVPVRRRGGDYGIECGVRCAAADLVKMLCDGICHHLAGCSINESGMQHLN